MVGHITGVNSDGMVSEPVECRREIVERGRGVVWRPAAGAGPQRRPIVR